MAKYYKHRTERKTEKEIERRCAVCAKAIFVWPSRKFKHPVCSPECRVRLLQGDQEGFLNIELPFEDEWFWRKVKIDDQNSCWIWQRATNGKYPKFYVRDEKRHVFAHRYVEEVINGPIPHRIEICHRCDTPLCVNPDHLFRGTRMENSLDMWAKGRGYIPEPFTGGGPTFIKLDFDKAASIRQAYSDGMSISSLCIAYAVSRKTISRIIHNRAWIEPCDRFAITEQEDQAA